MQPKFTLNTSGKVLTRIVAFAMIFFVSAQLSFGQKTEEMRQQLTQRDADIGPPPPNVVSPPVIIPKKNEVNATQRVFAPTVIATPGPPQYPGNNSRGFVNSMVTFAVENTNSFAIVIQKLDAYFNPAVIGGNPTGSSMTLWYSTTSLSGDPGTLAGPTWLVAGTSTLGAIGAAGVYPVMSGLTLQIPANTTFRFAMQSTLGVSYSGTGTGAGSPSPNNFSAGGVNLQVGDFKIAGLNVGYAGDAPSGTRFNARYFMGAITFDQAVCIPNNATAPIISSVPSSTCAGAPITLKVIGGSLNGAADWKWYTGSCGGTLVATGSTVTVSPGVTTTYFVRGEGGCAPAPGPCASQTVTVTPCTCLTPDVATICSGSVQKLTVTPTGATTQTFGPGAGVAIPSSGAGTPYPSNIAVSGLPNAGVYVQSVAINGFSHTWPEDVDIVLRSPSGVNVILMSDVGGSSGVAGRNLVFSDAAANNLTAAAIQSGTWKPTNLVGVFGVEPDNLPAPIGQVNQPNPALSIFGNANPNGNWGLYVVDDFPGDLGSITSWSITFNIVPTATWTSNPAAPNTMFTNAAATVPYVSGTSTDVIWVNPTVTTTYTATFSGGPCAPTQSVTVTVLNNPNITINPNPGGCAPVTLTASGGVSYSWTPGTGLNTTTGAVVVATPSADQTYTVLGYGANGCSATASVPVKGISTAAVISAPPATLVLMNESFSTAALPAGWSQQNNSQPVGTGAFSIWYQGSTSGTFAPNSPPDFRGCAFLSGSGLSTLSNWLLSPTVTTQAGDVLTFWTIGAPPAFPDRMQVRWSGNGGSTNVGATATSVGDFTTLLVDINPTYTLTGYPASWTKFTVTVTPAMAGTGKFAFRYFVENGGPAGGNSNFIGLDDVQLNRPLSGVCPNTVSTISVAITGGVAPYTLVFTNGTTNTTYPGYTSGTPIQVSPAVTSTYTIVSVTGANGCAGIGNTGTATINVIQPPAITGQPANATTCVGANASFTVTATPLVSTTTYQWQESTNGGVTWSNISNGGVYGGATTATLTLTGVTNAMNGYRYRAVVSGQCPPQPVTSASATLTVNQPPSITTQPSASVVVCVGSTASMSVVATTPVGTLSYQWQVSIDGGITWANVGGATSATYSFTAALSQTGYRYRVIVTTAPCAATATSSVVTLTVNPLPTVVITSSDLAITPGQTTTIVGTSNPAANASTGWSWTLNGSVVPAPPAAPFTTSSISVGIDGLGTYQARATTISTGCSNLSNTLTIGAEASDGIWIYPNPNNGNFQIRVYYDGQVAERRVVRIYNIHGQLVAQKEFDLVAGSPSYMRMEFALPKLAAGTYTAKVSGKYSGSIKSGLFVIAQ